MAMSTFQSNEKDLARGHAGNTDFLKTSNRTGRPEFSVYPLNEESTSGIGISIDQDLNISLIIHTTVLRVEKSTCDNKENVVSTRDVRQLKSAYEDFTRTVLPPMIQAIQFVKSGRLETKTFLNNKVLKGFVIQAICSPTYKMSVDIRRYCDFRTDLTRDQITSELKNSPIGICNRFLSIVGCRLSLQECENLLSWIAALDIDYSSAVKYQRDAQRMKRKAINDIALYLDGQTNDHSLKRLKHDIVNILNPNYNKGKIVCDDVYTDDTDDDM